MEFVYVLYSVGIDCRLHETGATAATVPDWDAPRAPCVRDLRASAPPEVNLKSWHPGCLRVAYAFSAQRTRRSYAVCGCDALRSVWVRPPGGPHAHQSMDVWDMCVRAAMGCVLVTLAVGCPEVD